MPSATVPSPNAGAPGKGRPGLGDIVLGRFLPALVAGLFVADQILLLGDGLRPIAAGTPSPGDWLTLANRVLTLAFFLLMVVLFVVRLPALGSDRRLGVVAVAMIGSYVVLAGSLAAPRLGMQARGPAWILASDLLIPLGVGVALWSLSYLRRSFSILPEARRLVTDGPYALTRNPLYLGELIAGVGVLLPAFGALQAGVLTVFVACQLLRIGWEEQVLAAEFGAEFARYRAKVPRLLPSPRRHR